MTKTKFRRILEKNQEMCQIKTVRNRNTEVNRFKDWKKDLKENKYNITSEKKEENYSSYEVISQEQGSIGWSILFRNLRENRSLFWCDWIITLAKH